MNVDDLLGTKYLAAEARNAVLAKPDDRQLEVGAQSGE